MRLRVSQGWAVSLLLAAVGCGRTGDVAHTGAGGGGAGAAAGGEEDAPSEMALAFAQSGTRLVALGYSSNEARLFQTFHDQQLGFDCDFVPDRLGAAQRCVPSSSVVVVYTDAGCTEPAAWIDRPGNPVASSVGQAVSGVATDAAPSCPGAAPPHRDAYRIGEQLSEQVIRGTGPSLYAVYNARCQLASPPYKLAPPVHRLVPLEETELVSGQRVSLSVGEGLRLTRLLADDGAELSLGVTGADRTPCEFQRDGECVPEPIARPAAAVAGKFFAALNADCTAPAFLTPYPPACGSAVFAVQDDHSLPPRVLSLQQATATFRWDYVMPLEQPITFTCNADASGAPPQLSAPGRDLTGMLPTARKLRRGTGPLYVDWFSVGQMDLLPVQADWRRASPGVVPTGDFVDDRGRVCEVLPADDGTFRCAVSDDLGNGVGALTTFPEVAFGPL